MLILLPNLLGRVENPLSWFAPQVVDAVAKLDGLIAESPPDGRRFLQLFKTKKPNNTMPIAAIDDGPDFVLEPILAGETWGLISDAGMPCIADPGSKVVAHAYRKGIEVQALPGPSSFLLAIALSGLYAQRFASIGYLDREREAHLTQVEKRSRSEKSLQLFIEAPYRNQETLQMALDTLSPSTHLCIATDLTLPTQLIISKPVAQWSLKLPDLNRRPTIFLILAN